MIICAERQKLLDCDGHGLVLGGPGSGKTTIALLKAARHIKEGLKPGQSVLFLSFSRAAVARVVEAAHKELKKEEQALLNIQTFHSFFWEVLKTHAYLLGAPRQLKVLLPQDERILNGGLKEDRDTDKWKEWCDEREQYFLQYGRTAFDLFAPKAALLLEKCPLVLTLQSQRFPFIVVDEAQDTGPDAWRCVELLSRDSRIVCLADLNQQIFDYLPGIGPDRIDVIRTALAPLEIDLGGDNRRSPGTEIAEFGRDILACKPHKTGYAGVTGWNFAQKHDLSKILRILLGRVHHHTRKQTGEWAKTVAILVPTSGEATKVSQALLEGTKPVRHKLVFDETETMLAARFVAYLLEPHTGADECAQIATALSLLSHIKRATGSAGKALTFSTWAADCHKGRISKAGLVKGVQTLLSRLTTSRYSGDPARDWTLVKHELRATGEEWLGQLAGHLDYLVAFNRGKRIGAGLAAQWERTQSYDDARSVVDVALTQDLIIGGTDDPDGIQVMNIHRAKGKQFDGVIVLRRQRNEGKKLVSNALWRDDPMPYRASRKILAVGVTRAKAHTLVAQQVWPSCPILSAYGLRSTFEK